MYAKCFKRVIDLALSPCALIVLSPVLLILTILGAIKMKSNPFFTQLRPGKDEKIFKLIKFRTMTCETDENGGPRRMLGASQNMERSFAALLWMNCRSYSIFWRYV